MLIIIIGLSIDNYYTSIRHNVNYYYYYFLFIDFKHRKLWTLALCREGGGYGLLRNMCMWGENLSLKTQVITHPGTSDARRCLTSDHVSD